MACWTTVLPWLALSIHLLELFFFHCFSGSVGTLRRVFEETPNVAKFRSSVPLCWICRSSDSFCLMKDLCIPVHQIKCWHRLRSERHWLPKLRFPRVHLDELYLRNEGANHVRYWYLLFHCSLNKMAQLLGSMMNLSAAHIWLYDVFVCHGDFCLLIYSWTLYVSLAKQLKHSPFTIIMNFFFFTSVTWSQFVGEWLLPQNMQGRICLRSGFVCLKGCIL